MSKTKALKIRKDYLAGLAGWLQTVSLEGKKSRIRTRFVSEILKSISVTEKERQQILDKYVVKEKDKKTGKQVWKTKTVDNGTKHFVISPEKAGKLNEEMIELYSEEFVLNVTPETEENIKVIKDILLETEFKFGLSGEEKTDLEKKQSLELAVHYDKWCEAFEAVK
jgi:DNA-directed RNA polymerase subunit F